MRNAGVCALVIVLGCGLALAQQYKVLYSFAGPPNDGSNPAGSLVADSAGNLYGVTQLGGSSTFCSGGCGTVFRLSPNSDGSWSESVLYNFCAGSDGFCSDGRGPAAGLVLDSAGSLYGVTDFGGTCAGGRLNCGIVFQLSPPLVPGGAWTYNLIHAFCQNPNDSSCADGTGPNGPLTIDKSGRLYGTVQGGGNGIYTKGAAFQLLHTPTGWKKKTIYSFCSVVHQFLCVDGQVPQSSLTFDRSGNLYGTTQTGGPTAARQGGTVYKLSRSSSGWSERVVFAFNTNVAFQDENPSLDLGSLSLSPTGKLVTTYLQKGGNTNGGLLALNPRSGQESDFLLGTGSTPNSGLVVDSSRHAFYGITQTGGTNSQAVDAGVIFQFDPSGNETVVYNFCQQTNCTDGFIPMGGLIEDKSGNLYGTASQGGAGGVAGFGLVFKLTP
jgi:uncharacterized repeat protein (TIGR03803 family)